MTSAIWELVKAELLASVVSVVTILNGWAGWTYWQHPVAEAPDMPIRSSLPYIWVFVSVLCGLYWNFKICSIVYDRIRRNNLLIARRKRIENIRKHKAEITNRPEERWGENKKFIRNKAEVIGDFIQELKPIPNNFYSIDSIEHISKHAKLEVNKLMDNCVGWKIKYPNVNFQVTSKESALAFLRRWELFCWELYGLCCRKDLESARKLYDKMKKDKII